MDQIMNDAKDRHGNGIMVHKKNIPYILKGVCESEIFRDAMM